MYYVYMVRCSDNSIYTGYTVSIEERLKAHNAGKASKYTRSRLPVTLVLKEEYETKGEALKRECKIKSLTREEKMELIEKYNSKQIKNA